MMSDESVNNAANNPAAERGGSTERVVYCQDCGKLLTRETARTVGSGVFCEPCLEARILGGSPTDSTAYTRNAPPPAATAPTDAPHPVLAGILGAIPGVGAVYNGQYAKALAHLVIFVVLSSMGDHVSGIFKLLNFCWWIYQIVDAYQTAKARLEGRPLPNPFGLNEVGERMGFGKTWPAAGSTWTAPKPDPASSNASTGGYTQSAPPPAAPSSYPPAASYGPVTKGPDWVGYVPPTNFASAPPPGTPPRATQASPAWGQAPYSQPHTGGSAASAYANVPPAAAPPLTMSPTRRFPVGAIWLIGLGLLFLLAEFAPDWGWNWNIGERWLLPVLFAGLGIWAFVRRMATGIHSVRGLRASVILLTLAVLFSLQAASDSIGLSRTWPVLFIVLGILLIAERTSLGTVGFGDSEYMSGGFAPVATTEAEAEAARTRAAWNAPERVGAEVSPNDHDAPKDGI